MLVGLINNVIIQLGVDFQQKYYSDLAELSVTWNLFYVIYRMPEINLLAVPSFISFGSN